MPALDMESQTPANLDKGKEMKTYIVQKLSLGRLQDLAAV